eukprot:scaffold74749_cov35-Cyclotella_meneghiniana.AAC.4
MVHEMGLKITDEQLAAACPDVGTLKNWEFDLAGGCLTKVIVQIADDAQRMKRDYDQPLKITLVTDHGNREGVDHFVKMIVWSSKDKDGSNVLRHFNLDIDKGGHSMVEAANAIHRSLQSMHLDDIDVEYSYITGDSGGGAKVQSLHPQLVKIGVMPEMIYLAVLMLNTVKTKRNNLDHLKKYYSMTMTQLLKNEHYIAGATTNFIQAFD